ncbi:hypothetical protein SARC_00534 [Sphaeroforma arctica JP610]|uniref:Uncharacterized protein n=1 Tax=Sphaeroforma arctica JP610 TaxID=667725 RepID=A0A0L0GEM7_9EUKA|nr:hypothetical protein SARC_00534 [Sphaeroforma arctica JP610]KNC87344.1 hypothetical protein SARC_00534 [Sphaeroforma arctica JP610]|eukprot:XP_014161246.1 hypothetical protein SARC_00534 [Sphaeroforma arctica JP610]
MFARAGSLLWALKQPRLDIHLFDAHFDRLVVSQTPGSPATYSKFLETATETRDEQEVLKMFETAQLWHWRAHRAALEAAVGLPPPSPTELESIDGQPEQYVPMAVEDLPDIMEALATHGDTAKTIPLLQNDFCARGKPYRDLPPEIHASLSGIAQSRLYSLGWVLGVYDDWQD